MRALATISAVVLLGASLASCDMPGSHQQQVAATPPPCHCAPPPTMMPPPAPTEHLARFSYAPRHHLYRHRYDGEGRYRPTYYTDGSQQPVDSYDYASSSRVTRSDGDYGESGYAAGRIVWVDGYGRGYFSNGPVTVSATMRGKRLDAYHGYDVDCPDDGEPR